ncbi:MAG: hypothetical protein SynsKO_10710 [Synoicihabitans sp.]
MSAEEHDQGTPVRQLQLAAGVDVSPNVGEAMIALSALVERTLSLAEVGREVDQILGRIMPLPNLFICLVREVPPSLRFVYCRDEHDRHVDRPMDGLGLTDQVVLKRRSLLIRRSEANALLQAGELVNHGVPSLVWLGAPLIVGENVCGVMATQDYEDAQALTREHEASFNAVAPMVGALVDQALRRESRVSNQQSDPLRTRQTKALIARIGHDVRSPLAVIQGYADLLRESLKPDSARATAERIFNASRELSAATDRMIDYTAVEAGIREDADAPVDLRGWKRSLVSWMEVAATQMGIPVSSEMTASGTASVRFNAVHVRQLLQHLLRVAFTIEGVAEVSLSLRVQPVVTIPNGLLRLAFEVKAQLPPDVTSIRPARDSKLGAIDLSDGRTFDGASVSLAIAERLAEKLGADVKVGKCMHAPWFATMVVTVPVVADSVAEFGEDRRGALSVMRAKLQEHSNRMVVLDLDPRSCDEVTSLVEEAVGTRPALLRDQASLAQRMGDEDLRVIIAASDSPAEINEIARVITASRSSPVTPYLIVVSREQSAHRVERLLDAGADAYVPRPLSSAALLIALSDAWLEHERRREQQPDLS